ncbi:MAG: ABC transporter substrate-binding protein [Lachnospiraceae bacterium]
MKKILSIILTIVLVLGIAGCGSSSDTTGTRTTKEAGVEAGTAAETSSETENETAVGETKVIVDHDGREVEIPAQINRIVVGTWPIAAQLSVYLGSAEKIVGVSPAAMAAAENGILGEIYPEFLRASTKFYEGENINVEELLLLNPDIVIGVSGEAADSLREAGIPVVGVSVSKWNYDVVTTTGEWLKLFDQIFGENKMAADVQAYTEQVQADIAARVSGLSEEERKKVMLLFTYSDATMTTSGKVFFGQSWCDHTGAINVGEGIETPGSASINMEQVYEWNPDVILITNFTRAQPEDLYNNAIGNDDWSTVSAVKNKQVYKMPLGWYRSYTPGVDTAITLQWVAKSVYPELFEDIDIEQVTREYFGNYFSIELTDDQLEKMFNPPREASAY